jgi:hypothetical protein
LPRKAKLGSGKRFASGKRKLMKKGYSAKRAGAIMAAAGRKKYGKKRFQSMAAKGRRRAARRK